MKKISLFNHVFQVITWEKFIEHGKTQSNIEENALPWCFDFFGVTVTHEYDNMYLLMTNTGQGIQTITPYDVILVHEDGSMLVLSIETFNFLSTNTQQ